MSTPLLSGCFGVPARYQHRVLVSGFLGALALRALFTAAGSVLLQYHRVVVLSGALLCAGRAGSRRAPDRITC